MSLLNSKGPIAKVAWYQLHPGREQILPSTYISMSAEPGWDAVRQSIIRKYVISYIKNKPSSPGRQDVGTLQFLPRLKRIDFSAMKPFIICVAMHVLVYLQLLKGG